MAAYRAVERDVVRGTYRGYEVVSMPPPSSGSVAIVQMLNILEQFPMGKFGAGSADVVWRMQLDQAQAITLTTDGALTGFLYWGYNSWPVWQLGWLPLGTLAFLHMAGDAGVSLAVASGA